MRLTRRIGLLILLLAMAVLALARPEANGWTLVGWNNLGMHCMDADYSVFSLLPPFNTIHAQLVNPWGQLVTEPSGITITYRSVSDPSGSINTTSVGKTNFWQFVLALFGASPAPDAGLAGNAMPGPPNAPQPMAWDPAARWFVGEGIPITPYDDVGRHNPYPMMRLEARDASGNILAVTDIVLPVSDEMGCSDCHASGGDDMAQPSAGWVYDPDPQRDFRLNILRLHDDRQGYSPAFQSALAASGYDAAGLYPTANGGKPVLCARCHASNALPGTGIQGISALTSSVHTFHGHVEDDASGMPLDSLDNRSACYTCHPGSTTRCLRGAMGGAVAADGTMAMQCQSCHGNMSAVGALDRVGWLQEPACQMCHTGTATENNGEIRYTSAFENNGQPRQAVDSTFATNPGAPAAGFSLYRFSYGHGGLACEACHGSTHAEYPSTHDSDNLQSIMLQGHAGPLAECSACHSDHRGHAEEHLTPDGGPHGMHNIGQAWADNHSEFIEEHVGIEHCQSCHGADFTGSVLSRAQGDRTLSTPYGTKHFWRGYRIGCYSCHNGPSDIAPVPFGPPAAENASRLRFPGTPVTIPLVTHAPSGSPLSFRVVSQPRKGTVGIDGATATYFPFSDLSGPDSFTYSAWDGKLDSNLATVTFQEGQPPVISDVSKGTGPLAVKIAGDHFQPGAEVFVGADTSPWANVRAKGTSMLVLKGEKKLKQAFPRGVEVAITVANPDGGSATASFTR